MANLCDDPTCRRNTLMAAGNGHLDCLEYAHRNGGQWHPDTTRVAASNGHLECLECAHLNGCPWDPETTRTAAKYGRLNCLEYIFEYCGDVVTWENAGLMNTDRFPKESKEFIEKVKEEWKRGDVRAKNIKG